MSLKGDNLALEFTGITDLKRQVTHTVFYQGSPASLHSPFPTLSLKIRVIISLAVITKEE